MPLIVLVPALVFASDPSTALVESLLAELSAEDRAALFLRLRERASDGDWATLRAAAMNRADEKERVELIPIFAERDEDGVWLIDTLRALPVDVRHRLLRPSTPVRACLRGVLLRRLQRSGKDNWQQPLNVGIELGLNRRVLADVVAEAIATGRDENARLKLLDYLARWKPRKLSAYLNALASAPGAVGAKAQALLPPLTPDAVTIAVAEPKPEPQVKPRSASAVGAGAAEKPSRAAAELNWTAVPKGSREDGEPNVDVPATPAVVAVEAERERSAGRVSLIAYSTAFGALSFGTVGDIAFEDDTAVAASAVIGSVIGGGIPYLLTQGRELTLGDATYIGSHASWAAVAGFQGARLLGLDRTDETSRADESTAILTGLGGMVGGALTYDGADWSRTDAAWINGVGVQAGLATYGALSLAGVGGSPRDRTSIAAVAAYGMGFLPAGVWVPRLEWGTGDRDLVAYSTGVGAVLGANFSLSSRSIAQRTEQLALGAIAGQGLGFVTGTGLTQVSEDFSVSRFSLLSGLGATAALGLAASGPASDEARYDQLGLLLNGGIVLTTGLGVAVPQVLLFAEDQPAFRALAVSWGTLAGASLPFADPEFAGDGVRVAGGAALGASLGLLGASIAAPFVDGSRESLRGGTAMLALGASAGAGTGLILCDKDCTSNSVRGAQAGAGLALLGATALADRFPTAPGDVGGGVGVGGWAAWNAGLATQLLADGFGRREAGVVTVAGTAGIAAGAVISSRGWVRGRDLLRFDGLWALRNSWGYTGARTLELGRRSTVATTLAAPVLGIGLDAALHRMVGGPAPATRYAGALAYGGATGALLGGDRAAWAAGFGALSAATLAPLTVLSLDDEDFGESLLWSGAGYLAGLSVATHIDSDPARGAALGGSLGLASGMILAPWTGYESSDAPRFGTNVAVGGAHGYLATGTEAGAGLGATAGLVYSVADNALRGGDRQADPTETLLGTAVGDLAGWGIARMRGTAPERAMVYGGITGFFLSSQLSPYTEFDADALLWLGSLGATAAGSGLVADPAGREGAAATAGALALGAAMAVGQRYRPAKQDTAEAILWGGVGLGVGASVAGVRGSGVGLALGNLGGTVVAPFTTYTLKDRVFIASTAGAGAGLGAVFPALLSDSPDSSARREGATLGAATGLAVGAAAAQWLEVEPRRIAEIAGTVGLAMAVADGAVALGPPGSAAARARARVGGSAAIVAGRLALEPHLELRDWQTPVAFVAVGTSLGVWAQDTAGRGQLRHGVQLGAGFGLAIGALASGNLAGEQVDRLELGFGSAAGQAIGYGVRGSRGALIGGTAAAAAAAIMAPYTRYSRLDLAYVGGTSVLGASYGYWLSGSEPKRAALGAGVGLLLGTGLSQTLDIQGPELLETTAVSGLAHALGHEIAWSAGSGADDRALVSVAAGASAWLTWPYVSHRTEFSPSDVAFVGASGAFGAWSGYSLAVGFGSSDAERQVRYAGIGAGAGVIAGGALTQSLALNGAVVRGASAGAALGAGAGFAAAQLDRSPNRDRIAALASLGLGLTGGALGGTVGRRLRIDTHERDDVMSIAAIGAWHGAWSGQLAEPDIAFDRRSTVGGAVAGAVVAGIGASILATETELTGAEVATAEVGWAAFSGLGAGLGLALGDEERDAVVGLQVGGLAGAAVSAWLAPRLRFGRGDVAYVALTGTLGATYGGWISTLDDSDGRSASGVLLGASGGVLGGAVLAQLYALDGANVLETGIATGLAHGLGHEIAWMLGADRDGQSVASLAAGGFSLLAYPALAADTEFSGNDLAFAATLASLGAVTGYQLAGPVIGLGGRERARATALGASVGLASGLAMAMPVDFDSATVTGTAWGAGLGTGLGFAVGQLALPRDRAESVAYGSVGLGVGGAILGGTVGKSLRFEGADAGVVAAVGGLGAWHGAWASQLFKGEVDFASPGRRRAAAGGAAAGAVVGTLAGVWLTRDQDYSGWDLTESALGWTASAAFGAGLGLTVSDDDRWAVGLMHGAGLIGGLSLARLAPKTEFSGDQMLLGSLTTGHFVWQGIGIGRLLELEPREFAGTMMMMTAGGGLLGAALGNRLQLDTAETWAAFSGELWGSWLGAWVGYLYADEWRPGNRRTRDVIAGVSAVSSNVGLLASTLSIGTWDEMTPRRMGWVNLFGAAGALSGAAAGALIPARNNVAKGNAIGTVVGLGAGVVVTGITGWGQTPPDPSSARAHSSRSLLLPEFEQVMPSFSAVPQTEPDWMPENAEGFYLGVSGRWR